jgi:hypothetical protein
MATSGFTGVVGSIYEERELALVAVHVAPVVALDHLDAGPAVLGEPHEVHAVGERDRDERVPRRVELAGPHPGGSEGSMPMLLHERLLI